MRQSLEIEPPFLFGVNMYEADVESAFWCRVFRIWSFIDRHWLLHRAAVWISFQIQEVHQKSFALLFGGKLIVSESFLDANEEAGVFRFFEREESHTH